MFSMSQTITKPQKILPKGSAGSDRYPQPILRVEN